MTALPDPCALLADFVATPSTSGDEQALSDRVCELLEHSGLACEQIGTSVLARLAGKPGPSLMLNSHLDTVPAQDGWSSDPWDASWKEDRLVGLGANDAKASAVSMLMALLHHQQGEALPGELWLALNACEETNNAGMAAVLERAGLPDAAVTGEPTGLEVVRAQAGLAVLHARWTGVSCHAAHVARVEHRNALLAAAEELVQLAPYLQLPREHELLGSSTAVATVFHAGKRHNQVPVTAEAVIDARLTPAHTADECIVLLQERMPEAEILVHSDRLKPFETAADHPLVQIGLECARKPSAIGSMTLSDMALLQGIPAIKCGPGETARSHTADEFILREELLAGVDFYRQFVPKALSALHNVEVPS